jgi:hypothetical protein
MFIKRTAVIIIISLAFLHCVYAAEEPCKQEYIFSPPTRELLEIETIPKSDILNIDSASRLNSKSNTKFIINQIGVDNEILIYTGDKIGIKLRLNDYQHRPLSGKWINEKLIYLEVWFNPHFGAYWIFDSENKAVLVNELQNDGLTTYQQCIEYYKNKK